MYYDPLLTTTLSKNEMLLSADNAIESKSIGVGGFNLAVLLGYSGIIIDTDLSFGWLGFFGICFLLLSLAQLFPILIPKSYESTAVDLKQHPNYFKLKEKELYLQLISNAENAFKINNKVLKLKSERLKRVLLLTSLGGVCVLLSFISLICK